MQFLDLVPGIVLDAPKETSGMRTRWYGFILIGSTLGSLAQGAPPDARALAERIDRRLDEGWRAAGVRPAPPCDDATFLRRVSLDLIGRIPTVAEARAFLGEPGPDARARVVRRLLESGAHARHFANVWRRVWLPQADTPRFAGLADDFEEWLATRLRDRTPYDLLTREILNVAKPGGRSAAGNPVVPGAPRTFLTANEDAPENLAASTTRAFLGINLECAQCHDHPFSRWTRDQFWQTAAFFARPTPGRNDGAARLALKPPESTREIAPKLLDGGEPRWPLRFEAETGRLVLAAWMTADDNPYFARNAVNRLWAQFFGAGLVEPLDDLSAENPSSHPELLDELSRAFVSGGFDLRVITEAIVLSRAYQLAATPWRGGPTDERIRLFAASTVRGLTGEQLYDSLRVAGGLPVERDDLDPAKALEARRRFAAQYRIDRASTAERSVTQALSLINGGFSADLTSPDRSPVLVAVADAPFLDDRGRIDALFLAALGRPARDDERTPLIAYTRRGGGDDDRRNALSNVFWALIHSSEFNTNH